MWQVRVFDYEERGADALLEEHLHSTEKGAKEKACFLASEYANRPIATFANAEKYFARHDSLELQLVHWEKMED